MVSNVSFPKSLSAVELHSSPHSASSLAEPDFVEVLIYGTIVQHPDAHLLIIQTAMAQL